MIGVRSDGRKELVALTDGYRESTESWADLLRGCRRRGMMLRHRYGAHCVTVGEDEQAGGVRRHDDHDQDSPRNRCLAEAMSVIMVTVAVVRDLLGQNRFQTV